MEIPKFIIILETTKNIPCNSMKIENYMKRAERWKCSSDINT